MVNELTICQHRRCRARHGLAGRSRADSLKRLFDSFLDLLHLRFVLIDRAGPEKAAQSIFLAARDDVDVQMRDALADLVVYGNEGSLGFHALLDGGGKVLDVAEEFAGRICWEIQ